MPLVSNSKDDHYNGAHDETEVHRENSELKADIVEEIVYVLVEPDVAIMLCNAVAYMTLEIKVVVHTNEDGTTENEG